MGSIISSQINKFARPLWSFCCRSNTNLSSCFSHGGVCSEASKWMLSGLTFQGRGEQWMPTWHHSPFSPSYCNGWLQPGCALARVRGKEEGKRFWLVCAITCVYRLPLRMYHTPVLSFISLLGLHMGTWSWKRWSHSWHISICLWLEWFFFPFLTSLQHRASLTAGQSEQSQRDGISLFFFLSYFLSFCFFVLFCFTFPLFYFSFCCFPLLTLGWLIWWSLLWHCCSCCCRCCCCWLCCVPS